MLSLFLIILSTFFKQILSNTQTYNYTEVFIVFLCSFYLFVLTAFEI